MKETFIFFRKKYALIFLGVVLFFIIFPRLVGIDYSLNLSSYKVMWLKLMGQDYNFSILEGPKPLVSFCAGIFPDVFLKFFVICSCALWVVCFCILSFKYTDSIKPGLMASFLLLFANNVVLPDIVFFAPAMILYITLIFLAIIFIIEEYHYLSVIVLFLGGLTRPEFWFFSLAFIVWRISRRHEPIKWYIFLPLVSPFLWMLFDFCISGDLLYSSHAAKRYCTISSFIPLNFQEFWRMSLFFARRYFNIWILIFGVIAGFVLGRRADDRWQKKIIIILFFMAMIPFGLYAAGALGKNFFLYPRFFVPIAIAAYFYFSLGVYVFLKNKVIVILVGLLFCLIFFKVESIKDSRKNYSMLMVRQDGIDSVTKFFDGYLEKTKPPKAIVLGNSVDTFSLRYGPEFSRKVVNFKELGSQTRSFKDIDNGLAVWLPFDTNTAGTYFNFLSVAGIHRFCGYEFTPVFVDSRGSAIVYRVQKILVI